MKSWALATALLVLVAALPAAAQPILPHAAPAKGPDVIYVPTPHEVVDAMLSLAEIKPGEILYDLGSGDGRIPIAAARRFGVRAVGVEISSGLIHEARANARAAGVSHLVAFRRQDLFRADLHEADVVTLYLLPDLNERLRPKLLRELKPGSRIVSHAFPMGDWPPEREVHVGDSVLYLWTVPAR